MLQEDDRPTLAITSHDSVGRVSEGVTNQLEMLGERLRELGNLEAALNRITGPVRDVLHRHSQVEVRLLELETLLTRERESCATLRNAHADSSGRLAALSQDYLAQEAELKALQTQANARSEELSKLAAALEEKTSASASWERDARVEGQRSAGFELEVGRLKAYGDEIEARLAVRTRELGVASDARDQLELERREVERRLETAAATVAGLTREVAGSALEMRGEKEALGTARLALENEAGARARAEQLLIDERTAAQTAASALTVKLDSAISRHAAADKHSVQVRSLLDEKTVALAAAEKDARNAHAELLASRAQNDALQGELALGRTHHTELQRTHAELREKLAVTESSLALKEALVDGAGAKIESLSAHSKDLIARHEKERSALGREVDRLSEELQKERAERTMAQGALDIARASRTGLLQQLSSAKRKPVLLEEETQEDRDHEVRRLAASTSKQSDSRVAFLHNANSKD